MREIVYDMSTGRGPLHIWGWEIPVYLFLGGMAAGIMVLSAMLGRRGEPSRAGRWLPFAAPIALSLGMGALFLDLELRRHVLRFYLTLRPASPMSWGSWILVAIYPATILYGLARLSDEDAGWLGRAARLAGPVAWLRALARRHEEALRVTTIGLGLALGAYTGILLGTLGARAAWQSLLLAPLFLASGVSSGAAVMMLLPLGHDEHESLRRWDLTAIGLELALLALFLVDLATGGATARAAASMFLGGRYTATFWSLVVAAGLLVPVALALAESSRRLAPTRLAPVLVLVGGFALRWILVMAGQA